MNLTFVSPYHSSISLSLQSSLLITMISLTLYSHLISPFFSPYRSSLTLTLHLLSLSLHASSLLHLVPSFGPSPSIVYNLWQHHHASQHHQRGPRYNTFKLPCCPPTVYKPATTCASINTNKPLHNRRWWSLWPTCANSNHQQSCTRQSGEWLERTRTHNLLHQHELQLMLHCGVNPKSWKI